MKTMLAKIKNSKGFISLEVIAIALFVIVLAAIIMYKFKTTAGSASDNVNKQIQTTTDDIKVNPGAVGE